MEWVEKLGESKEKAEMRDWGSQDESTHGSKIKIRLKLSTCLHKDWCLLSKWRPRKERQRVRLPKRGEWGIKKIRLWVLRDQLLKLLFWAMRSSGPVEGTGVSSKVWSWHCPSLSFPLFVGPSSEVQPAYFWGFYIQYRGCSVDSSRIYPLGSIPSPPCRSCPSCL